MELMGSRRYKVNTDYSDYDYAVIEENLTGTTKESITNEHFEPHKHCYHVPKEYLELQAKYQLDCADYNWLYNPGYYMAGLVENPLNYKDILIHKLKFTDYSDRFFYNDITKKYRKRFWYVVYNVYVVKENTIEISDESLSDVKLFHDMKALDNDYTRIFNMINDL